MTDKSKTQKQFRKIFLLALFIAVFVVGVFLSAGQARAAEYYVDFTNGLDSNKGNIKQPLKYHPWMGEYFGSIVLQPGDTVYMKRGEVWQSANPSNLKGFILTESSGTEGNLITTTAYGSGVKPKIKITNTATAKSIINVYGNNYLKFDNLDLQHSVLSYVSNYDKTGIRIQNDGHHIYITNNEISFVSMGVAANPDAYHIYVGDMEAQTTATQVTYSNYIHDFGRAGIYIHGRHISPSETNSYVYHNYIRQGGFGAPCHSDVYGIAVSKTPMSREWPKNVFVRYNRVEDIPVWTGLDTHGCSNCYFEHNYVYNTAMAITAGNDGDIADNYFIRNNTVENPIAPACFDTVHWPIHTERISDIEISGNKIFFTQRPNKTLLHGMMNIGPVKNGIVKNNLIYNGPLGENSPGIYVAPYYGIGNGPLTISENEIRDTALGIMIQPLALQDDAELMIKNNLVHDVNKGFLFTRGTATGGAPFTEDLNYDVKIYNNLISAIDVPISWLIGGVKAGATLDFRNNIIGFSSPKNEKYIYSSGSNYGQLIMDNNLYYNSTSATPFDLPGLPEKNWNDFQSAGFETNGIGPNIDPKFIGANDFHLQADSPARDKGVTLAMVTNDYDGIVRPQGAAYDIGAYEYTGSVASSPDVDGSGTVNIKDIQGVIRCVINSQSCNFTDNSDVNGDGSVNIKDIQAVIRCILDPNCGNA